MTPKYTIYDHTGCILNVVQAVDIELLMLNVPEGADILPGDFDARTHYIALASGTPTPTEIPPAPDAYSTFDTLTGVWSDLRDDAQKAADTGAEQAARRVGVDLERRRRLDVGKGFAVSWRTEPIHITGRAADEPVLLGLLMRAQGYKAAGVTAPLLTYRDGHNQVHKMTPDQMIELVMSGMNWFEAVMAASWSLKDSGAIPADFADDKHWPSS